MRLLVMTLLLTSGVGCASARAKLDTPAHGATPMLEAEERNVSFHRDGVIFRAVLSLPRRPRGVRVPGAVLIAGSGPQSADGALGGQLAMNFGFTIPVYAEIAAALQEAGFAVLRYDKRTCGDFNACSANGYPPPSDALVIDDLVDDARAAIAMMRSRQDVDGSALILVGHSKGGTFVPEIMHADALIAAGVLLATPQRPIDSLLADQVEFMRALLGKLGVTDARSLESVTKLAEAARQVAELRTSEASGHKPLGVSPRFWLSWLRLGDRAPALAKELTRPVLVLMGDYDLNLGSEEFLLWRHTLETSRTAQTKLLPCVTHALNCVYERNLAAVKSPHLGKKVHDSVLEAIVEFAVSSIGAREPAR